MFETALSATAVARHLGSHVTITRLIYVQALSNRKCSGPTKLRTSGCCNISPRSSHPGHSSAGETTMNNTFNHWFHTWANLKGGPCMKQVPVHWMVMSLPLCRHNLFSIEGSDVSVLTLDLFYQNIIGNNGYSGTNNTRVADANTGSNLLFSDESTPRIQHVGRRRLIVYLETT